MMAKSPAWPRPLRLGSSTRFRFRQAEQPPWAGAAQPVKLAAGSAGLGGSARPTRADRDESAHWLLPAAVPSYWRVTGRGCREGPHALPRHEADVALGGLTALRAWPRHRARFARD